MTHSDYSALSDLPIIRITFCIVIKVSWVYYEYLRHDAWSLAASTGQNIVSRTIIIYTICWLHFSIAGMDCTNTPRMDVSSMAVSMGKGGASNMLETSASCKCHGLPKTCNLIGCPIRYSTWMTSSLIGLSPFSLTYKLSTEICCARATSHW